jgi:chromosome segregation ATPase
METISNQEKHKHQKEVNNLKTQIAWLSKSNKSQQEEYERLINLYRDCDMENEQLKQHQEEINQIDQTLNGEINQLKALNQLLEYINAEIQESLQEQLNEYKISLESQTKEIMFLRRQSEELNIE